MRNAALSVSFSCALTYVQCCSACNAYLMSISQTPRLSLRSRFMKHESCSPCSNICLQLLFMSMAQDLVQAIVLLGQHPSRCLSTDTPHSSPLLSSQGLPCAQVVQDHPSKAVVAAAVVRLEDCIVWLILTWLSICGSFRELLQGLGVSSKDIASRAVPQYCD